MEQVKIDGITYNVVSTVSREDMKANSPLVYQNMLELGQAAWMYLQRPKGKKETLFIKGDNGRFVRVG